LDKDQLREQARLRRRELAKAVGLGFGTTLIEYFDANFQLQPGEKLGGYWPITNEADVKPLLKKITENGGTCLLPVVIARDTCLLFREWLQADDLAPSEMGIPEPHTNRPAGIPDILLVPLLAYDAQGNRLGYGGGYYDRTLSELRGERKITAIGIAYSGQEVDSIPNESFDQRLDWVITEAGATEFNADKVS